MRATHLLLPTLALAIAAEAVFVACGADEPVRDAAATLREGFPNQAARVLERGTGFVDGSEGVVRDATPADAVLSLRAEAEGVVRLHLLPGALDVVVREIDAHGPPSVTGHAVSFARSNGTSYWLSSGSAVEEWLWVDSAPPSGRVAEWEVSGASLRQRGSVVDIVDASGRVRLVVSAPAAFGEGSRQIHARMTSEGTRLGLSLDDAREGETVLVDPSFDPRFIPASPIPQERAGHTANLMPNGEVLVVGGFQGLAPLPNAWLYDQGSDVWTFVTNLASARLYHTTTVLRDGRAIVAGGQDQTPATLAAVEGGDPLVAGSWGALAPLQLAREAHAATLLADGRLLVVGGGGATASAETTAEIYDPTTGAWSFTAPLANPHYFETATLLPNGKVLAAGAHCELYDATSDAWTACPSMHQPRFNHTATSLVDGRVLVAGGNAGQVALASAEIYDSTSNAWTDVGSMDIARVLHTATLLPDGDVLVTGGVFTAAPDPSAGGLSSSELFDPKSGTWTDGPPMADGRAAHTATAIGTGQVLVASGVNLVYIDVNGFHYPADNTIASVDLYSPYLRADGVPCTVPSECGSGFCVDGVCCDSPCQAQGCTACSLITGAKADGTCTVLDNPSCDLKVCSHNSDCATGFCADGVCCDMACTGPCQSCVAEPGHCAFVPRLTDPRGRCSPAGASGASCTQTCDGKGACMMLVAGSECQAPACTSDGKGYFRASSCEVTGKLGCSADGGLANMEAPDGGYAPGCLECPISKLTEVSCAPFLCDVDAGGCLPSCRSARDCAPGAVCNPQGACEVAPLERAEDDTGCAMSRVRNRPFRGASWIALGVLALVARRRMTRRHRLTTRR